MTSCPTCGTQNSTASRFCGNCATPLPDSRSPASQLPTEYVAPRASQPASRLRSQPSSGARSVHEGRFEAGVILAERYKIIELLGQGGMGEVYRAIDLKLDQSVALKFLLGEAAADRGFLDRFLNEVRIARQVSHPNVCRVYDIGEIEGMPFLSMEYVDGEDLGKLLRRIGRLPQDKALEIARKLCAGLAAAHDKGVLHRDLKPGNIMLDGQGNVLITDFGLAGIAGSIEGAEIRSGTPAYMAPEQLAGKEVSARSDIYSLGLVLYEIFTGRRAYQADSLADLQRMQSQATPVSISSIVGGIDAAVERAIERCLDPDPKKRPGSALAVAAALPGGDPLAAALAAGETPSPELVAAAGEHAGFPVAVVAGLFLFILAGLGAMLYLASHTTLLEYARLRESPDVLEEKALEIAQKLGYTNPPLDSARSFTIDRNYTAYLERNLTPEKRRQLLAAGDPPPVLFWYRQSPRVLDPLRLAAAPSYSDPPVTISGMVNLMVDPKGRLRSFLAIPSQVDESADAAQPANWSQLLELAGQDIAKLRPAPPKWVPLAAFDHRAAWTTTLPDAPELEVRYEAASWRGRPVYFATLLPWDRPTRMEAAPPAPGETAQVWFSIGLLAAILVAGGILAYRNYRRGRGDVAGARRLGLVLGAVGVMIWFLIQFQGRFTANTWNSFQAAVGFGLVIGGYVFGLYLALEPYVRRRWPRTLISWSRLLSGHARDPLVGSHLCAGLAVGVLWAILAQIRIVAAVRMGSIPEWADVGVFRGASTTLGLFLNAVNSSVQTGMAILFFLFLLRAVFRKEWIAGVLYMIAFVGVSVAGSTMPLLAAGFAVLQFGLLVLVMFRLGLLSAIAALFASTVLSLYVTTWELFRWYGTPTLLAILLIAGLSVAAFRWALGGRRIAFDELLET